LDASEFEAEGDDSAAAAIVTAYKLGWKHVISFDWRGQRFCGAGLGANSQGFRIDAFGNPGDYLGSGLDGAEIYVHASAQDQVAQIMKAGKLVIYGDVGQTFMYAAKGGDVYVLGNAAGRPLINAVGRPRVVINGTCLDYLAESFMAGDPLNGGGFVVVNGIRFGADGQVHGLETPYPGSNLFSLASGGAIYLRDPMGTVGVDQLNGGRLGSMDDDDWKLITPYLEENEKLFGIRLKDLLRIDASLLEFSRIYRKVEAIPLEALGSSNVDG
jgi:glutamate synthase domain-containing protein 3